MSFKYTNPASGIDIGSYDVSGTHHQSVVPVHADGKAKGDTGTSANVASSASNVTLLAANANRKGATVFNDSTQVLYLKLGATASATSFTVKMDAGDYYEVPFSYTGIIDGIWASANGNARVTEVT